jgi:hypothetical protein
MSCQEANRIGEEELFILGREGTTTPAIEIGDTGMTVGFPAHAALSHGAFRMIHISESLSTTTPTSRNLVHVITKYWLTCLSFARLRMRRGINFCLHYLKKIAFVKVIQAAWQWALTRAQSAYGATIATIRHHELMYFNCMYLNRFKLEGKNRFARARQ